MTGFVQSAKKAGFGEILDVIRNNVAADAKVAAQAIIAVLVRDGLGKDVNQAF